MNGIKSNIEAMVFPVANDRVNITITDEIGGIKAVNLAPAGAIQFAVETLEAAYEAYGHRNPRVLVGVVSEVG